MGAKVTDFAFPRKILGGLVSSMRWCAPEVLTHYSIFTDRSDTYGLSSSSLSPPAGADFALHTATRSV